MKSYIYLAGPYSHPDVEIRQERFEALTKKAAELMLMGYVVFSPITHGHAIAERHNLPTSFEWWGKQCTVMLQNSSKLIVLMLEGWSESVGVNAEIDIAKLSSIEIEYLIP